MRRFLLFVVLVAFTCCSFPVALEAAGAPKAAVQKKVSPAKPAAKTAKKKPAKKVRKKKPAKKKKKKGSAAKKRIAKLRKK
jgi:hypothetical protein